MDNLEYLKEVEKSIQKKYKKKLPPLPADFIQPEPANNFAHKS